MTNYNEHDTQNVLRLEEDGPDVEEETEKCTYCEEEIVASEMSKHTISCIKNSSRCKKCDEYVHKDKASKQRHLIRWRDPKRIKFYIENDEEEKLMQFYGHGAKPDIVLD